MQIVCWMAHICVSILLTFDTFSSILSFIMHYIFF